MKEQTQRIIIWFTTVIIGALILVVVMIPVQMNAYEQYYEEHGEYPPLISKGNILAAISFFGIIILFAWIFSRVIYHD